MKDKAKNKKHNKAKKISGAISKRISLVGLFWFMLLVVLFIQMIINSKNELLRPFMDESTTTTSEKVVYQVPFSSRGPYFITTYTYEVNNKLYHGQNIIDYNVNTQFLENPAMPGTLKVDYLSSDPSAHSIEYARSSSLSTYVITLTALIVIIATIPFVLKRDTTLAWISIGTVVTLSSIYFIIDRFNKLSN